MVETEARIPISVYVQYSELRTSDFIAIVKVVEAVKDLTVLELHGSSSRIRKVLATHPVLVSNVQTGNSIDFLFDIQSLEQFAKHPAIIGSTGVGLLTLFGKQLLNGLKEFYNTKGLRYEAQGKMYDAESKRLDLEIKRTEYEESRIQRNRLNDHSSESDLEKAKQQMKTKIDQASSFEELQYLTRRAAGQNAQAVERLEVFQQPVDALTRETERRETSLISAINTLYANPAISFIRINDIEVKNTNQLKPNVDNNL